MSDYFLSTGKIRDYALLTIGIATGLRASDLTSLKLKDVLKINKKNGNPVFRQSINITEQKTGKHTANTDDEVFITGAVVHAITLLLNHYTSKGKTLNLKDDWLFQSKQPIKNEYITDKDGNEIPNPLYGEYVLTPASAHRVMKAAARKLDLPMNVGSHTMRKTFGCLHYVIASRTASANPSALGETEIALRHSRTKETLRYLTIRKKRSKFIREEVSRFLLGESDITEISLM